MEEDQLTIYVRNTFQVKWNRGAMFLTGKKHFIEETRWTLIAACAEWPLLRDGHLIERESKMVQIWQVTGWQTLYKTMVQFSESGWYRKLGESLASEDHDLLINATLRPPKPLKGWKSPDDPGYAYVYELSRPRDHLSHRYLREIYWFDAQMAALEEGRGWELVWCASQITSQPAEFAFLWRVPVSSGSSGDMIPREILDMVHDPRNHKRYDHMIGLLQTTQRKILYPIYTEQLYLNYLKSPAGQTATGTPSVRNP